MKTLRLFGAVVAVFVAVVTLRLSDVYAQGPINAPFIDNQSHTLPATTSVLYQFTYNLNIDSTRPDSTITLVNGTNSGLGFQVWTPQTVTDMVDNKPIGQGTAATVDCNTGAPLGSGGCQSPDLSWKGTFGASGTYYVLVTNTNTAPTGYLLTIQGSGVSLGAQTMTTTATTGVPVPATAAPAAPISRPPTPGAPAPAPALPPINMDDPARAVAIVGQQQAIAGNSAIWYAFNYPLSPNTDTHTEVTVTLVNGTNSGLRFEVYGPEQLVGWYNNTPVGRSNTSLINCDTGAPAGQGGCQSPDLTWVGNFANAGTYYVRVVNINGTPANAVLTIH